MQYNRSRWYDPHSGRFLSEDPAGFVDGANLYAYVGNGPTNATDPWGTWADDVWIPNRGPGNCLAPSPVRRIGGADEFWERISGDLSVVANVAGIFIEPVDWVMTAYAIWNEPTSGWSYAGLLPFVPAAAGKVCKIVGRTGDDLIEGTEFLASRGIRDRGPDIACKQGREFRRDQLEIYEFDVNAPSHVRGWLKNERRRIEQGRALEPRAPRGYELSHGRAAPARQGFDYSNSRLQGIDLNWLEERIRRQQRRP